MQAMSERLTELAERLEQIAEELSELAIDELKGALRSGNTTAAMERKLTQARRAVDKATHILRSVDAVED